MYWDRIRTFTMAALTTALLALPSHAAEPPKGGTVAAVENTKGPIRIAFLSFQNNPFWMPVTEGAGAANDYLSDVNAKVEFIDLGSELAPEAGVSGVDEGLAKQHD